MENDGFSVCWFSTEDQPAEKAAAVSPAQLQCTANTGYGKGCKEKMRVALALGLAAHSHQLLRCSVQLNSTASPKNTWPEGEFPHITLEPPELQALPVLPWISLNHARRQSTGLVVHPFRPALKYITNLTKLCLLKIFCLRKHSEIHSSMVLCQSFTSFKTHTSFLKHT